MSTEQLLKDFINNRTEAKTGSKFDKGKARMDLLDSEWLEGVANILSFGAEKYAPNNWRNGIECSRLYAAAMRHLTAWNKGENIDKESGLSHLHHAACCLMFLSWTVEHHPDLDDRYIDRRS